MKRKIRCAAGVFLIGMLPVLPAAAEEAEVIGQPGTMEIPISETMPDLEGENVLVKEPVSVSDADGDGILTVNDALNLAGDAIRDPPDASNVYVYAVPDLDELLAGLDSGNGGVTGSDHANAYIYKEASYFDRSFVTVDPGAVFTLTLRRTGFDENRNLVTSPITDAVITIDGAASSFVTDAGGKVTMSLDKPGTVTLSAVSGIEQCVPPAAKVLVLGEIEPATEGPTEETAAPTGSTGIPEIPTEPAATGDTSPAATGSLDPAAQPTELPPAGPDGPSLDSPPTGEQGAIGIPAAAGASLLTAVWLFKRRRRKTKDK